MQCPGSLAATLATRLPGDGPTRAIAEQVVAGLTGPHLRAITALPDLPYPAQSRVMTGHTNAVRVLAGAPDGSWLASAGWDGEVRIWDLVTGGARHALTGHTGAVEALVVASDGSWLASAGWDGEVRIWDLVTGGARHALTGHTRGVVALAGGLGWIVAGLRRLGWGGADLGSGHRRRPSRPHRPHPRGSGVGGGPGWIVAGLRQ